MRTVVGAAVGIILLVCASLVAALLALAGGTAAVPVSAWCATDANLATILATIRTLESGGDYTVESAGGSTASGAYQFLNSSWDGYGGYTRAADAPPELQDQKAAELVRSILAANNGDVAAVPVSWYIGEVPPAGSADWDRVPYPEYGNQLTPRQYLDRWLTEYDNQLAAAPPGAAGNGGCVTAGPAAGTPFTGGTLPDSLDCGTITWAGYRNGRIPESAMRYRPHSTSLHPAASESFDQLYAAAQAAGLDLRSAGYRPASAGGNTAGRSCHGLGLAVDITALTGDPAIAFASPEFAWLCANANTYGWINPRWALPEGMRCGVTVGTGRGGNRGDHCCFLEAWHIEAAGVVITHPDFAG